MRHHIVISIIGLALTTCIACDFMRSASKTLNDAADIACNVFGAQHPEEFEALVLASLPDSSESEYAGFDPAVLCRTKEILDVFRKAQLQSQQKLAIGLAQ